MPRLPRVTGLDVLRALKRAGWTEAPGGKGSHRQLRHPARAGRVTVPIHAGRTLGPALLSSILDQARMTPDELQELL